MRSLFTTFIMLLLAANLRCTTAANITGYVLVIDRANYDESHCIIPAVNAEIKAAIKACVEAAADFSATPERKYIPEPPTESPSQSPSQSSSHSRRRAAVVIGDTHRDESRRLQKVCEPGCTCTLSTQLACYFMGICYDTGTTDCRRRVEEQPGFLRTSNGNRELSTYDNNMIKAQCKSTIKALAKAAHDASTHNCLGDPEHIDVWASTRDA